MSFDMNRVDPARETMPAAPYYTAEQKAALPAAFIEVPNVYNFRHTGEHRVAGGRRVRTDLMFRSAEPSPITEVGKAKVKDLGITTLYDLRSESEIQRNLKYTPIVAIPGTTRVFVPLHFPEPTKHDQARRMQRYGDDGTDGFVESYAEYLDVGGEAYRTIFTHLRDRPTEPFLVHCMAGKDRTGVITALVLDLCGVAPAAIADEYALTTQGIEPWLPLATTVLLREPSFAGHPDRVARLLSSKRENMLAFVHRLREQWGGAEGYLRTKLGFSAADVATIRTNATEPDM